MPERDFEWVTLPRLVGVAVTGTALGVAAGSGVSWAAPLFVAYLVCALTPFIVPPLRRWFQRSRGD